MANSYASPGFSCCTLGGVQWTCTNDPWQLDGMAAYMSTQGMSISAFVHQFVCCYALNAAAVVVECHLGLGASDGHLCCRNRALTLWLGARCRRCKHSYYRSVCGTFLRLTHTYIDAHNHFSGVVILVRQFFISSCSKSNSWVFWTLRKHFVHLAMGLLKSFAAK